MNKKIKIIDLLNKIAYKNSIPKKIMYEDNIFTLQSSKDYYCKDISRYFFEEIMPTDSVDNVMNEEVELLEDNTEDIEEIKIRIKGQDACISKINELVRAVNKLKSEQN